MTKSVPHQITLYAWSCDPDTGSLSIYDICETSYHYASRLARRMIRNTEISYISACLPHDRTGGKRRAVTRAMLVAERKDARQWLEALAAALASDNLPPPLPPPPYPFCRYPKVCAGRGYCTRDPACNN